MSKLQHKKSKIRPVEPLAQPIGPSFLADRIQFVVNTLTSPSAVFKPSLTKHGVPAVWVARYGDISGHGPSPRAALLAFDVAFDTP